MHDTHDNGSSTFDFDDAWLQFDQRLAHERVRKATTTVPGILVEIKTYRKRGRHSTGKKGRITRIASDGSQELLYTVRGPTYRHVARKLRACMIDGKYVIPPTSPLTQHGRTFFAHAA